MESMFLVGTMYSDYEIRQSQMYKNDSSKGSTFVHADTAGNLLAL